MSRQPKSPSNAIESGLGEKAGKIICLDVTETSSQTILAGSLELSDYPFDPFGGFTFAINHLGKAAAVLPLKVNMSIAEVGHGHLLQLGMCRVYIKQALLYLL